MTFYEFGKENEKSILLIHPSLVMFDYFEYLIPLLEKDFHLIIPALPGYDEKEAGSFTSVEEIADEIEEWLKMHSCSSIGLAYGCSMGGSIVIRMLSKNTLSIENAVIDGGITPYQLPKILTYLIGVRDFLMVVLGKWGGKKLLMQALEAEYSKEDIAYIAKVLDFMSLQTIWNTFYSCNNYKMPARIPALKTHIEYWYAKKEEKARRADIAYMKKKFETVRFVRMHDTGHAGMAVSRPHKTAQMLARLIKKDPET